VEGAYVDGGEPEVKDSYSYKGYSISERLSIDVQALVATAVFTLPIGDSFELFAKPGIAYWDSTTRYHISADGLGDDSASLDDSGSAFFLGAGAGFNFNENLGVRLEYEWFEVAPEWDSDSEEFVDELDASSAFLSVSFVYTF
jgi:opacity protein-like surface antigen